jgi:hypothetical protein
MLISFTSLASNLMFLINFAINLQSDVPKSLFDSPSSIFIDTAEEESNIKARVEQKKLKN